MAYAVQFRRGTTLEHSTFTGAVGEVTINTTTNQLIVHDGTTVGGHVVGGTVTIDNITVCATADESSTLSITAPAGYTFSSVDFASYGNPSGACESFVQGGCHEPNSQTIVESYLLGNSGTIDIPVTNEVFGDPCYGTAKRLYVQATVQGTISGEPSAPTNSGPSTLTDLNITDGTSGQMLTTDGAGTFTFTTPPSSSGGSQSSTIISPAAFAYVNTTSDGSGTNISWANWNASSGSMDFTFATSQSDTNYAVISDVEGYDDINIMVTSKTTTGFTISIYDDNGNVSSPDSIAAFSITVYSPVPTFEVSGTSNNSSSIEIFADMAALIAKTGMTAGNQAYISSTNKLYMYTGTGWYLIATVQNDESLMSYLVIENSRNTVLLATAVDTYDNNNITDSSTNNHSIIVHGGAHAGTFSPYRSGGYSMHFDGSGDKLTVNASPADFNFGTSSFTIEAWIYPTGSAGPIFNTHRAGTASGYYLSTTGSNNRLIWGQYGQSSGNGDYWSEYNAFVLNEWQHVSINRDSDSSNFKLYVNGVLQMTTTNANNFSSYNYGPYIGGYDSGGTQYDFEGYISDLVVTNGSILRTGGTSVGDVAFTPPTEALEPDANTVLLISNLPYIKDSSSNSHDITTNGNTTTQPLSPYDYVEYEPTAHGGSVYFDGTGDCISISNPPATLGANDWTFETWYYSSGTLEKSSLLSQGPANGTTVSDFTIMPSGQVLMQTYQHPSIGGTGNVVLYQSAAGIIKEDDWYHIALTHEYDGSNGGTYTYYVNGNQIGNVTYTNGYHWNIGNIATQNIGIGIYKYTDLVNDGSQYYSDWKISNSVTYTSNFTPPTAPQSSSSASLHIKGTDASIIDKSQTTNIQLFDNTTGSTGRVKFTGSKSIYFDGSGDYLRANMTPIGTDDFTIEFWYNAVSTPPDYSCIFSQNSTGNNLRIFLQSDRFQFWIGQTPTIFSSTGFLTLDHWYHIALVKNSGTIYLYIDGTLIGSAPNTSAFLTSTIDIGHEPANSHNTIHGYIQDFRITKGLARYTANFTPPTEPFKG